MEKVAITIAAVTRFGRMWRETTQAVPPPIACEAATKSLLRSTSACARAMRQYGIQRWIDRARMMLVRLWPKKARMASASRIGGNAQNVSTTFCKAMSRMPPQ
jgi:hypothetical protein